MKDEEVDEFDKGFPAKEKLKLFGELILDIATTAITGGVKKAIELAIRESGYENALRTAKKDDYESRLENLDELVNAASDFENSSDDTSLSAFLENAVLIAGVDTLDTNGNGQVMLMTMHNSKGLEFPTVFIAGMEEGLFPLQRSAEDPAALEEERRLCYVAMTRAMKRLYISYAHSRRTYGQIRATEPSRFLLEIPGDLCESREKLTRSAFMEDSPFVSPFETNRFVSATSYNPQKKKPKAAEGEVDFKTGDKIEHDQWGVGTVITVTPSGNQTVIQAAFAGLGIKKFILGFSQVKKIEK